MLLWIVLTIYCTSTAPELFIVHGLLNRKIMSVLTEEKIPLTIDELDQITNIADLTTWTLDCHACSLRTTATQVVHSSGDPTSPVMLVGMNPAFCEDGTGIPFCGAAELAASRCMTCAHQSDCYSWFVGASSSKLVSKCRGWTPMTTDTKPLVVPNLTKVGNFTLGGLKTAGQLLDDLLISLKIDRSKLYITNGALCASGGESPKAEHYNSCARIRIRTEQLVNPKVIITFGRDPLRLYAGKSQTMAQAHGIPFTYKHGLQSITVVPTYHPAAILRSMQDSATQNLEASTNARSSIRDLKISMSNDVATALNLLTQPELLGLLSDPKILVNGKLPLRT